MSIRKCCGCCCICCTCVSWKSVERVIFLVGSLIGACGLALIGYSMNFGYKKWMESTLSLTGIQSDSLEHVYDETVDAI